MTALAGYSPPWELIDHDDWSAANRPRPAAASGNEKFILCGTDIRAFKRMQFLRGTGNLFADMGYDALEFSRLRDMVHEFNMRLLEKLATIQMVNVHLPTTDGRWLIMSRYTQPQAEHKIILNLLGLSLPLQPPPRITSGHIQPAQSQRTPGQL